MAIEKMAYGPFAISHLENGKTVFVDAAVPGDVVEASIYEEKKSYAKACAKSIIEPSPYRREPQDRALVHSLAPWQIMTYDEQLSCKEENVKDALSRVGHFPHDEIDRIMSPIVSCEHEWHYRNKIELAVTDDAAGRLSMGFYEQGSSAIDICQSCKLAVKPMDKAPKALTGALRYLCGDDRLGIYRVGVRASRNTGSVQVALWTPPSSFPRSFAAKTLIDSLSATSIVRVLAHEGSARQVKKVEVLAGEPVWLEKMSNGISFGISAPSFFQVNTAQAQVLVDAVMDSLGDVSNLFVADLYCGAGTFTLPLAKASADVVAIEQEGSSIRDLRRNAERNGVDIEIVCDDVLRVLPDIEELDACVVDPPRSGLGKEVVSLIAATHAHTIVYVSCDPQSLSRDLRLFADRGYALERVTPVDMFPQTYHVETISVLRRSQSPQRL